MIYLLALLLSCFDYILASPTGPSGVGKTILKRSTINYADNCNSATPSDSGYQPPQFPTRRSVVAAAWQDAKNLADLAAGLGSDSTPYKHYYGETHTEMLSTVQSMFRTISSDDDSPWTVTFDCGGTPDCGNSPAVTDPEVGDGKTVWLCPAFWTASTSAYLLPPKDDNGPTEPAVKPFKSRDAAGWCQPGRKSNWFATAGHTILHELTHLDSVASLAGLEPDIGGRHGTQDYNDNLRKFCELSGARNYLGEWEKDMAKPEDQQQDLWDPTYNAESYAGMATEAYFGAVCNFNNIGRRDLRAMNFGGT